MNPPFINPHPVSLKIVNQLICKFIKYCIINIPASSFNIRDFKIIK